MKVIKNNNYGKEQKGTKERVHEAISLTFQLKGDRVY